MPHPPEKRCARPAGQRVLARLRAAAVVEALAWLCGCATLPDGGRWGEHAGFAVGRERTGQAATLAAKDLWAWAPLAGAAVMQIDNWDRPLSEWAVDHTPVYDSVQTADDWSNDLEGTAGLLYIGSVFAAPSGDYGSAWWDAKLHGALVGVGAMSATGVTTGALKTLPDRQRTDGGQNSVPSAHTSLVSVDDTLTASNLVPIRMSSGAHTASALGLDALAFATGSARVEGGAHDPSGVLVGRSIGIFVGRMFTDAFFDERVSERLALSVRPAKGGGRLLLTVRF